MCPARSEPVRTPGRWQRSFWLAELRCSAICSFTEETPLRAFQKAKPRPRRRPANGTVKGTGNRLYRRQITTAYDDLMFFQVRARAARAGTSYAEQVRLLVEIGLEELGGN
jgi:hypothetical protein